VVAGGYAISAVSGGALNPAVAIGVDTLNGIVAGGWYVYAYVKSTTHVLLRAHTRGEH
jgi:hypothetical protein